MTTSLFDEFASTLGAALSDSPLPGREAQLRMAPLDRAAHLQPPPGGRLPRSAAVLALFYPDAEENPRLLLTVRPSDMNQHAGQVALPGGRHESGETLRETALRETHEEVLIPPGDIDILGALTPLYVIPSRFQVHPFVGIMRREADLSARSDEVADMFGVPACDLTAPERRSMHTRRIGQLERSVPHFDFEGHVVWGATAMMLAELAALFEPQGMFHRP